MVRDPSIVSPSLTGVFIGGGHNKHGTGSRCTLPKQCRPSFLRSFFCVCVYSLSLCLSRSLSLFSLTSQCTFSLLGEKGDVCTWLLRTHPFFRPGGWRAGVCQPVRGRWFCLMLCVSHPLRGGRGKEETCSLSHTKTTDRTNSVRVVWERVTDKVV